MPKTLFFCQRIWKVNDLLFVLPRVFQRLKYSFGQLMFQTSQGPKFGFAFREFPLIILLARRITFDGDLRERDGVYRSVQLSVAEWIGMHLVLPAR